MPRNDAFVIPCACCEINTSIVNNIGELVLNNSMRRKRDALLQVGQYFNAGSKFRDVRKIRGSK